MFERNMALLSQWQPAVSQRVMATPMSDETVLFRKDDDSDVNLAFKGEALHNIDNPRLEAAEIFEGTVPDDQRSEQSLVFLFGLGLGYLLRYAFLNCKGNIIVYEPFPEVLRMTLEAVDFTQELSSNRVRIITQYEDLEEAVRKTFLNGDAVHYLTLPSYEKAMPNQAQQMLQGLQDVLTASAMNQQTVLQHMHEFTQNALKNLPHILKYPDVGLIQNTLQGKPGVLVSAGPSLDVPGVLDTLKAIRDHVVVVCIGQAAKALDKAGIVPDFVVIVETKDVTSQLQDVSFCKDVTLVTQPQAHAKVFQLPTRQKLMSFNEGHQITHWLSKISTKPLLAHDQQGTVSITALLLLLDLGCNPIFLLGQDLACPDGKMYAQNSVYQNCRFILLEGKQKLVFMDNKETFFGVEGYLDDQEHWHKRYRFDFGGPIAKTKGWNGEEILSQRSYNSFRVSFEAMVTKFPNTTFVNCSEGGAFIHGYEHMPFSQAVQAYAVNQYNTRAELAEILASRYAEEPVDGTKFKRVFELYQRDRAELEELAQALEAGMNLGQKILSELATRKALTHSIQGLIRKLDQCNLVMTRVTKNNMLLNDYICNDLMLFEQMYGRRMNRPQEEFRSEAEEMLENIESNMFLFQAIENGRQRLIQVLDESFRNFPRNGSPQVVPV